MDAQEQQREMAEIRRAYFDNKHVVFVYRKGGGMEEEWRLDSESDDYMAVMNMKFTCDTMNLAPPIGTNWIGAESTEMLPSARRLAYWRGELKVPPLLPNRQPLKPNEAHQPTRLYNKVRVQDVFSNEQTEITTVIFEAV